MRTALDSSVLLDIVTDDREFADASERALRQASAEGSLVVCECVLAELRPVFEPGEIDAFLSDFELEFVASTRDSALLAGEMFSVYIDRRTSGSKSTRERATRVVADFLIGAHAMLTADRLLARDRGYYRDYFKGLTLMEP